ncbi:MAG: FAD-binding protein [Caldilineaceae bacterium]
MSLEKTTVGRHALIMGASLGGLLTARVLSQYFDKITVIERDAVTAEAVARKGQPQTRHLHGLLATGLETMTHYFPDLPRALTDEGAIMRDFGEGMTWYTYGGMRKRFTMGVKATTMSRPLLESLVRVRVLALPNITLVDQCAVKELVTTPDRQRVTAVTVELRSDGQQTNTIAADLVVDCTGRGSRTPQWLADLGYNATG